MDEKKLRAAGIDYDAALAHFAGKRDIYERYLAGFAEDTHAAEAKEAFVQQDHKKALEETHALKGLAGTLGLTKLFELSSDIVRALRAGQTEGLAGQIEQMAAESERIKDAVRNA